MDTLIHADIFFFVTTVAVVVVGIAFTVALIYLIKILSNVKKIMEQVQEEAVLVREDIKNLRGAVKQRGARVKFFSDFLHKLFVKKKGARSKGETKKA